MPGIFESAELRETFIAAFLCGVSIGFALCFVFISLYFFWPTPAGVCARVGALSSVEERSKLVAEASESVSPRAPAGSAIEMSDFVADVMDCCDEHVGATEDFESSHLFWPRVSCLAILLLFQSVSSTILEGFSSLFNSHTLIISFLTTIVGLGGNVSGQSMVLVVREIALGRETDWKRQLWVGLWICAFLVPVIFLRVFFSRREVDVVAILTVSLSSAVVVVLGAAHGSFVPLVLQRLRIDPAHAAPLLQVTMDIVGVSVVCCVAQLLAGIGHVHVRPAQSLAWMFQPLVG